MDRPFALYWTTHIQVLYISDMRKTAMSFLDLVRAWWCGVHEGFTDGIDAMGRTYDGDPTSPRSEAYDRGRNLGEWIGGWPR